MHLDAISWRALRDRHIMSSGGSILRLGEVYLGSIHVIVWVVAMATSAGISRPLRPRYQSLKLLQRIKFIPDPWGIIADAKRKLGSIVAIITTYSV